MKPIQLIAVAVAVVMVSAGGYYLIAASNNTDNDDGDEYAGITVTQFDGTKITFDALPERIVCLSTYAAELIVVYNATDRVVGIANSVKTNAELGPLFPHAVDVGAFNTPNIEALVGTDPDVVITYTSSNDAIKTALSDTDIKTVALDCTNVQRMKTEATSLGILLGKKDIADKFVDYYTDLIDQVTTAAIGQTRPAVYLESFSAWSASAVSSSAYAVIAELGGADLIFKTGGNVDPAAVTAANPEFIIKTPTKKTMTDAGASNIRVELMGRQALADTTAVQNGDVWIMCSQLFGGPRSFAGAIACSTLFFGELPSGVTAESALEEYNELFGVNFEIDGLIYPSLAV